MSRITRALLLAGALALLVPASAAADPAFVSLGSFAAPIYVTAPPRDTSRVFVVERGGTIQVVKSGTRVGTPFLDISGDVDQAGERGLLSMTFAPDYATSGLFYVYMVARQPVGEIQIREYRRSATNADRADPTGRIVFRATHNEESNHNGGQVEWGPDGYLWFATGDGGGGNDVHNHARDLASPLGKVLRIDPRPGNAGSYGIPASNPFGTAVWAYGLRNPFRFSFDRGSGDLWIGDVGQGAREEVDRATASGRGRGGDYGWACREGTVAGPKDCTVSASLHPAGLRLRQRDRHARGDGRLPGARPGAADADRPLRVRGRLRRPGALLLTRLAGADGRRGHQPRGAQHARLVRRGRVRARLRGLDRPRQRRADPGRRAGRLRAQAGAPGAAPVGRHGRRWPGRLRPHRAARADPGRGQGPRRAPREAADRAHRERGLPRDDPRPPRRLDAGRARTSLRAGRRTVVRLRPKAKAVKRIRRSLRRHKHLTLRVSVTAVDAAGNTGHAARRLKVKRA